MAKPDDPVGQNGFFSRDTQIVPFHGPEIHRCVHLVAGHLDKQVAQDPVPTFLCEAQGSHYGIDLYARAPFDNEVEITRPVDRGGVQFNRSAANESRTHASLLSTVEITAAVRIIRSWCGRSEVQ
jgi:hypothetical protein